MVWSLALVPRHRPLVVPVPVVVLVLLVLMLAGCAGPAAEDHGTDSGLEDPGVDEEVAELLLAIAAAPEVRFETDHGTIRMLAYTELLPTTAGRFIELVEDGFYDVTLIHRVVDDFVIQGGDPSGTGQMGSGQTVPLETHQALEYVQGSVGMARDLDPDSGDSQWFITERPAPHLHAPSGATGEVFGHYALFAQVFDGMSVVRTIASVPVVPGADRPVEDVRLVRATTHAPPQDVDLLTFPPRLDQQTARVGAHEHQVETVTPRFVFTDHLFPVTVIIEPLTDGAEPPTRLWVTLNAEGAASDTFPLEATADDPWVFEGAATPGNTPGAARLVLHDGEDARNGTAWAETSLEIRPFSVLLCHLGPVQDVRCPDET